MSMRLSPGAKLVLGYMYIEHVINGREYLTIGDLVSSLGLSERRLRTLLGTLRRLGYIEAFMDPLHGKRLLYRLSLGAFDLDKPSLEPGVYLIDCGGCNAPWDFTLRQYAAIRASNLLVVAPSFRNKEHLLKLTKCTCSIEEYGEASLRKAVELAGMGRIVSIVGDFVDDQKILYDVINFLDNYKIKYSIFKNCINKTKNN
ncbi:MAG: helix-turn-helix domain-containing protein [Thermoproteus sp.]|nr:helix-turn-helix domain-containing protein [Thermoproteus sp.]